MVQLLLPMKYLWRPRLPPEGLTVINFLIAVNWDGQKAIVPRYIIKSQIQCRMRLTRAELSLHGYASSDRIKAVYEPLGWSVLYLEDDYPASSALRAPGAKRLPAIFIFSKAEETSQNAKDRTASSFRKGFGLRERSA